MKIGLTLPFTCLLAIVPAASALAAASAAREQGSTALNRPAPLPKPVRLTTFTVLKKETAQPTPAGYYTRLKIVRDVQGTAADSPRIPYAKRDGLRRFFSPNKYSATVTLKTDVAKFSDTTPLITRLYESSRKKGESFSRTIEYDGIGYPLFLVGTDSRNQVARFQLAVDVSKVSTMDSVGYSISLVTKALQIVSPAAGILTTLSEQSTKDAADALDKVIGTFNSTSIREVSEFDFDLTAGNNYTVEIFGPRYEVDESNPAVSLGKWSIGFAAARPSIFSVETDAAKALPDARSRYHTILAFELLNRLGEYASIASYLKQQDWWATDLTKLESGTAAQDSFCRKIRSSIATLGLNELDGRLIAEAVVRSEFVTSKATAAMSKSAECKAA